VQIFERYDTDGSGALSKEEVKAMFKELGYRIESAELNAIMAEVGGTDKLIQYEEFEQASHGRGRGGSCCSVLVVVVCAAWSMAA